MRMETRAWMAHPECMFGGDGAEGRAARTLDLGPMVLWVRSCVRCLRIDHRRWFAAPGEAVEEQWSCGGCGGREAELLRTLW